MSVTIRTIKVERELAWYADNRMPITTLLESSKGRLSRIVEYWPAGEAGNLIDQYGVLDMTRNKFAWIHASKILIAIQQGYLWEVRIEE